YGRRQHYYGPAGCAGAAACRTRESDRWGTAGTEVEKLAEIMPSSEFPDCPGCPLRLPVGLYPFQPAGQPSLTLNRVLRTVGTGGQTLRRSLAERGQGIRGRCRLHRFEYLQQAPADAVVALGFRQPLSLEIHIVNQRVSAARGFRQPLYPATDDFGI